MPLTERPELAVLATARRLHAASGGVMAYLMELIRGATYLALAEGRPTLDLEVLGRAFEQRLASVRRGPPTPSATMATGARGGRRTAIARDGRER